MSTALLSWGASPLAGAASTTLGGWRLLRQLGRGRRSAVYLAQRAGDARLLAMKVADGAMHDGFAGEHALAQALAHPNLVHTTGHGRDGGRAWLAMEHAAGGALAGRRTPLPREQIGALLLQGAGALAALHAHGWVHRDIKPANLLLRASGELALADFGCACRAGGGDGRHDGAVIGSPRYAAPEQSRGDPAQPAADVYSLGVVLFELLAGRPPFPGTTLAEITAQHLLAPVPRLPADAARWQPLLDGMLAKDPSQRPRAAQVAHFREPT